MDIDTFDEFDIDEDAAPEQDDELIEEKLTNETINYPKLDYKLKTIEERNMLVKEIVGAADPAHLTPRYLEILTDYIMGGISKDERKEHKYLTDNRLITINKREMSFEGLAEKFENGEDGIYNLMTNDKNMRFMPKMTITEHDINTVPGLKDLRDAIAKVEAACEKATGRDKYLLKKQLIDMRKDQYVLKSSHQPQMAITTTKSLFSTIDLSETRYIDENGDPASTGLISLFNSKHISEILCHYKSLKVMTRGRYQDDFYYLIEDFDKLFNRALAPYPLYKDLALLKIENKTNAEIQEILKEKYNISYSVEYISSLWRNKIPKLLAEDEQNTFLTWYYTEKEPEKAVWKKCSCCGQKKLANNRFFSKYKTSKDGFYSLCKLCRNKKTKNMKGD